MLREFLKLLHTGYHDYCCIFVIIKFKELNMPHIVIKMYPGTSEEDKVKLAQSVTQKVTEFTGKPDMAISVAIVEVEEDIWMNEVYDTEIKPNMDTLYKKPGY
jgi:4-oxalocrotonate tautomerase